MKYLKTYEGSKGIREYWCVPIDDKFRYRLMKIGCPKNKIDIFERISSTRRLTDGADYIFIGFDMSDTTNPWGWMPYAGNYQCNFFRENKFKFKGIVKLEDYEINAFKYNL